MRTHRECLPSIGLGPCPFDTQGSVPPKVLAVGQSHLLFLGRWQSKERACFLDELLPDFESYWGIPDVEETNINKGVP